MGAAALASGLWSKAVSKMRDWYDDVLRSRPFGSTGFSVYQAKSMNPFFKMTANGSSPTKWMKFIQFKQGFENKIVPGIAGKATSIIMKNLFLSSNGITGSGSQYAPLPASYSG